MRILHSTGPPYKEMEAGYVCKFTGEFIRYVPLVPRGGPVPAQAPPPPPQPETPKVYEGMPVFGSYEDQLLGR